MTMAQWPFLATTVLFMFSGLHCSSPSPDCPELCTCPRALLLNCSSSGLSSAPQHIQDSVTELDLSHNLLDSVTLRWPHRNLRNVWLGNNSITHLSLCIERNLGSQSVRGRHLRRLSPGSSHGCVSWAPTLQLLSVERNQLVQLPEGLEGSESLQVLELSFNRISTLRPGDLSHLQQLKVLHLQHNLITSLHPQIFQDLVQLQVLDLSFNMLTSLHPLMYLSLRNIGADVQLGGNRWQCDCNMRSLKRRMAYDSDRGLQVWSMVCAFPSILSGKDLLQLEENDLNCFGTEKRSEHHRDVTVHSGSEILLSCSAQDSVWWTPSGQAPLSQPYPGMLLSDVREKDTGIYVCMSEAHEVVSVFNLQISRIGDARRKTRSLPRTVRQIIPQGITNKIGQEKNQRTTQGNLALAVCLSVFITFLIAFILGVLARPFIDILWKKATNKKTPSLTNSVSSVEQGQHENKAYSNDEEPDEIVTHRERRVTFSTVDFREITNVQYYDTIASGDQESINSNDAVIECETAKAGGDTQTADDSGSENSLQQSSPEDNQRDGRELSGITDADCTHSPDPVELQDRRSPAAQEVFQKSLSSSCSDSSSSERLLKENQMTQEDHATPKSPQMAEDSVQQSANFPKSRTEEVPQISIEDKHEIPGFSSEPFADWSPHTNTNPADSDLWQETDEQFEFSDSARGTSARSSSMFDSFNDSKLIVVPTSDKHERDDISSSSSYVSEDEPTQYTVNSDQEEEDPEARWPALDLEHTSHIKRRLDIKAPSRDSSSSSNEDEDEATYVSERPGKAGIAELELQKSQTVGYNPDTTSPAVNFEHIHDTDASWPPLDLEHIPRIKKRLDIKGPSPDSHSSAVSKSEDDTGGCTVKQRPLKKPEKPGKVGTAELPLGKSQTASHDLHTTWPAVDLEHVPHIKRRLDIKGQSLDSSSVSDSEDETTSHIKAQMDKHKANIPVKVSQTASHDPGARWPLLDLEHIPRIKKCLDIKGPSLDPHSSGGSGGSESEDDIAGCAVKQMPEKVDIAELCKKSHTVGLDLDERRPVPDIEQSSHIKRHLEIKAPSQDTDSSTSSDVEDETTHLSERPGKVGTAALSLEKSQTVSHDLHSTWPAVNLEHVPHIKRRLDIQAPSLDPSSSSDSEDEITNHIKDQMDKHKPSIPVKVSQTVNHDPGAKWPLLDLEHIPRIKKRLDIKGPSLDSHSSAGSEVEDDIAGCAVKQRPEKVDIAELQKSQTVGHELDARRPILDVEQSSHIKRHLEIKPPSQDADSSASSDVDDETTHLSERPGKVGTAALSLGKSQTVSHDLHSTWPAVDLEHVPHIKRRLDIQAPSLDSSSCSDGEDEITNHIKDQMDKHKPSIPVKVFQTVNHDPGARWPLLDLEHIPRIKKRLDIKGPSLDSHSSAGSEVEDDIAGCAVKQRPEKVDIAELQKSQTVGHELDARRPILDVEQSSHIKRDLEIKASSQDTDSSTSSDAEDGTTHLSERPGKVGTAELSLGKSQTVSHDLHTTWPDVDLEYVPHIKRRLDIKGPSPSLDSSSGSNSEDETTNHIKDQMEKHKGSIPVKVSKTASRDPGARWPLLDLEHIPRIKKRLDIKGPSLDPHSSAGSESEDDTAGCPMKQRPLKVDIAELQKSQTVSHNLDARRPAIDVKQHDLHTTWPAVDLEHVPHIKRRLDIKAPSLSPDSSSSSDSEEGKRNHIKDKGENPLSSIPIKVSQTVSDDPQTQWPALDLEHVTRIKRRLDVKVPSSSSDEQDEYTEDLSNPSITVKPDQYRDDLRDKPTNDNISTTPEINPELQSRWATMNLGISRSRKRPEIKSCTHITPTLSTLASPDLEAKMQESSLTLENKPVDVFPTLKAHKSQTSKVGEESDSMWPLSLTSIPHVKRALDIRAPLQRQSSSSNSDEDETTDKNVPDLSLGVPRIKRRLNIKGPEPNNSLSSCSDSENEVTGYTAKQKRYASNMPGITDNNPQITYNRKIIKDSLPFTNETKNHPEMATVAQEGLSHIARDRKTTLAPRPILRFRFDDILKKRTENSRHITDVDLPSEIRWTGVGRHMPDFSISSSLKHLNVGVTSSPGALSVEQELAPHESSNSSSDNKIKQDVTSRHKYSTLSSSGVPFASSTDLNKFDKTSGNTSEILRSTPEDGRERRGLSALKAMSSERQKWDTEDDHGPQDDSNFNKRKSDDVMSLPKQLLAEFHLSSTSGYEKRATDLPDNIPYYRRHDVLDSEPPQEAPPPIPTTLPPDEG